MFRLLYVSIFREYQYFNMYTASLYEVKSLNNRNFIITFFTRVLTEVVYVLFFDTVPLLRNTLGPRAHKLADAL